jgi:hypothetical protein
MTIKKVDKMASLATVIEWSCEILAIKHRSWRATLAGVFILDLQVASVLMVVLVSMENADGTVRGTASNI